MVECPVCQIDVPAGEYCGLCGVPLAEHGQGPALAAVRAYSASPGEHLLKPTLVSSLFPHLPPRSRMLFLMGLVLLLAALIATTCSACPPP